VHTVPPVWRFWFFFNLKGDQKSSKKYEGRIHCILKEKKKEGGEFL